MLTNRLKLNKLSIVQNATLTIQIHARHSYMAIAFVVLFVTLMNTPNFLAYKIIEMRLSETCNITDADNRDVPAYIPGVSNLALEAHCLVLI